jgi:O-antigen ligase
MVLAIFGMMVIGGRASFMAVFVVVGAYLATRKNYNLLKKENIVKLVVVGVGCVVVTLFFMDDLAEFVQESIMVRRILSLGESGDSSLRLFFFERAITLFMQSPLTFMFGAGMNSFPVFIQAYDVGMYPHNIILELLAEYGVIGCLIFLMPIIYILYIRRRNLGSICGSTEAEKIIFLLALYQWILYSVTGGLRESWVLIFFTFLLLPSSTTRCVRSSKPNTEGE